MDFTITIYLSHLYKNAYLIGIVFYPVRIYNDTSVVALVNDNKVTQLHRPQIKGKAPHQFAYKDWLCVRHNNPSQTVGWFITCSIVTYVKTYIIYLQRRFLS